MSLTAKLRTLLTLGQGVKGLTRGLSEDSAGPDPLRLFDEWFSRARTSGIALPEAMTLATSSKDGAPSARMVLLKGFDARGFVFFGNYHSRKGRNLDENPRAALICHWTVLQRQVRIEGTVVRTSAEESETYFRSRPYGSRIAAWASDQSATAADPDELVRRVHEYERKFPRSGPDVPLPPFWGGYRVVPERIEFWQGRTNRMHDRLCYERTDDGWKLSRLYP